MPGLLLGDVFPDFEAETTTGKIKFHEYLGDSWVGLLIIISIIICFSDID